MSSQRNVMNLQEEFKNIISVVTMYGESLRPGEGRKVAYY